MSKNHPTQKQGKQNNPLPEIKFWDKKEEDLINLGLFNEIAEEWAKQLRDDDIGSNNYSQIRKYYDEILLIDQKLSIRTTSNQDTNKEFRKILPYLKMIRAKVYYSRYRKSQGKYLVGDNFVNFITKCLQQVNDYKDFQVFKTFFEALMGFLKYYKGD